MEYNEINLPIDYNWTLGWSSGMAQDGPRVTPLLAAVIERDVEKMEFLKSQGAVLRGSNTTTLRRIVYHVIGDYNVMEWLMNNGMSRLEKDINCYGNNGINADSCLSPTGYSWGLSGRAYYMKRYDLLELFCAHGFSNFHCYEPTWEESWDADSAIFQNRDLQAIDILLSYGYVFQNRTWYEAAWYEEFVVMREQVRRKSIALDDWYLTQNRVPKPTYESVPIFFGKKEILRRNQRKKEDYEDRVRASKEFIEYFGMDRIKKLKAERDYYMEMAINAMVRRGRSLR